MSFLIERSLPRFASRASTTFAPRTFSSTSFVRKSATDSVKDTIKTVDKAAAQKIVDGIEVTESAAQKAKEVAGMSNGEAKGKAAELKGEAKGKASELAGEAKGKANEFKS